MAKTNASHYSKVNLFIRSLIFSTYSITSMAIYSFIVVAAWIFPVRVRHALIRWYLMAYMWVLKKVCLIDYKVEGLENIPQDRTGIILSKHQSTWETFFLPTIFHAPAVIVKRELFWVPFFGWALAAGDPISIDRSNQSSAMQQLITKGKRCLEEQKRWILIFPEGTRVPYGEVGKYKLGGARLAHATGHPVIPIAHNAGKFWPRRKFLKIPGTVHVVVGPVIEVEGLKPEEISDLAKNWIEGTIARIDSLVDKSSRQ